MDGYRHYISYSADTNGFLAEWYWSFVPLCVQEAIRNLTGWGVVLVRREVWMMGEHTGTYFRYKWQRALRGE